MWRPACVWPLALNASAPATGGVRSWIRLLTAYWLTMMAAGVFIFGLAMSAQGIAASLLPRRHFLRVSSLLQLGAFCLIVGVYFLQPMVVTAGSHSGGATTGTSCVIPVVLVPRAVSATQRIAGPRAFGAQRLGRSGTCRLRDGDRVRAVVPPHASADRGATGHRARGGPRAMAAGLRGRAPDRDRAVQRQDVVPQRTAPRHPRVLLGDRFRPRHHLPEESARPAARGSLGRQRVARDQRAAAGLEHRDDGVRGAGRPARIRDATGPAGELDLSHRCRFAADRGTWRRAGVRSSSSRRPRCGRRRRSCSSGCGRGDPRSVTSWRSRSWA